MFSKISHIISFRLRRLQKNILNSGWYHQLRLNYFLPLGLYDASFLKAPLDEVWDERIQDVLNCPDNKLIERHPDAGKVSHGKQVMHNGIFVTLGGYYGEAIVQMLEKNKGVHEPQEELAFEKVLSTMPDGATMFEFGAYWSFYSIWFNKKVNNAKNFLVEPELFNIMYGKNNFRLNKVKGNFTQAFIGKTAEMQGKIPVICVDDYVAENNVQFIDILHSDIQGFEYDMLLGAEKTIAKNKIGYFFISTHGNDVHNKCLEFLIENDFKILCNADELDTYSLDGLIVARSNHYPGIDKIEISLKTKLPRNTI